MKARKKTFAVLAVALVLILAGSILAMVFNTGCGSVKVSRISFDTQIGQLSGLYLPKDASAENPKPTVVVTHGYLNSAEMQDANAIELSRRGYVVLALDMYDHGHSSVNAEAYPNNEFFGLWSTFWINSLYDAVQYMYEQPYVLKDAQGNGIIGVTGHSMGGFSSTVAMARDEGDYAATGIRKIYCGLSEGSDFSYSGIVGVTAEAADAAGGGRIMGKVAAQYDEFFFNSPDISGGTVRHKDYVATPDAQLWLQQEAPSANTWYDTSDGGKRIIYQPAQTHPWNHFSTETTGYAVSFYTQAFAGYQDGIKQIDAGSQIWVWKEFFEFVALIGFVLMIVPTAELLMELPFLKKAKTGTLTPAPSAGDAGSKFGSFAALLALILIPALLFESLWDADTSGTGLSLLFFAGLIFALSGVAGILYALRAQEKKKAFLVGSCFVTVSGALLALVAKTPMYQSLAVWTAPSVNSIAYWTIACALISLLGMSVTYVVSKARTGAALADYGVELNPMAILASLCTAVLTVAIGYGVLFLVDALFKTDFRIWTFAFKTWDADILPAVLKYLPTFFLFYLVSSAAITVNTNTEKLQGVKGYLLAVALNAGGIALWLVRQYVTLFSTGVAAHPNAALSGIVLVAMVPTLAIAACFSRALYKRTGNLWTPAFLNALLMTIMTVANTTVYFK